MISYNPGTTLSETQSSLINKTNRKHMSNKSSHQKINKLLQSMNETVIAEERFLKIVTTGLIAKGHVLIEDVPGTGKTLTAKSFAKATGLEFNRIQFTPDLLPSDITGSHIYNESQNQFEFKKGPIFSNVILADEINRAPPKTQAALLEAMGEKQVTVDNTTFELPKPFFVIATQNPIEQEGVFPLPEAQKDRFMLKTQIGYPDRKGERKILDNRSNRQKQAPQAEKAINEKEVKQLQSAVEQIECKENLRDYMVDIGRKTRKDDRIDTGASPRAIQRLFEASKAKAMIEGRGFVVPDDVKQVAEPVLKHRMLLSLDAEMNEVKVEKVIESILQTVEVPEV